MLTQQTSDLEMARELLAGSQAAFDRFVHAYRSKLFHYSYLMCGQREDAEEVAQETLLKVFESLEQLRDPSHLKAWVFRIAKNACLMKRRKSVFAPKTELSLDELRPSKTGDGDGQALDIADWSALPDSLLFDAQLRQILSEAIQELPETYRSVVLLRDVEELSPEETAEALELSTDVIKTRLYRGRLALRQYLDQRLRHWKGGQAA